MKNFSDTALFLVAAMACLLSFEAGLRSANAEGVETPERKVISFTSGPVGSNAVALTFDDGPHPRLTPQLLEILKAENVPATFFFLGNMVEKYPEVARAVADAGHEVANHGHSHDQLTKLDSETIREEIDGTQERIREATGTQPVLFRAPYGSVNDRVRAELLEQDLELVGWAVDPRDWKRGKTSDQIVRFILDNTSGGDIILLHDIHKRSIASVEGVIRGLKEKGFTFTTAGDLVAQKREELERIAAMPKVDPAQTASGATAVNAAPAPPPVIPLGKSRLKRATQGIKSDVAP